MNYTVLSITTYRNIPNRMYSPFCTPLWQDPLADLVQRIPDALRYRAAAPGRATRERQRPNTPHAAPHSEAEAARRREQADCRWQSDTSSHLIRAAPASPRDPSARGSWRGRPRGGQQADCRRQSDTPPQSACKPLHSSAQADCHRIPAKLQSGLYRITENQCPVITLPLFLTMPILRRNAS